MDGITILKKVREWSGMPVIVVSARTHEKDKVTALDLGADDYITKPFGTWELLARICTAIRHTRATLKSPTGSPIGKFFFGDLGTEHEKRQPDPESQHGQYPKKD